MDQSALINSSALTTTSTETRTAEEQAAPPVTPADRVLTVCLAGVPNAGKTALMNGLTGGGFHTANYPGVTVTISRGKSRAELGAEISFVDLPGVHSTVAPTIEEELSCSVIEGRHDSIHPDALIIVVDATQLERHLKFAAFVARQGKPVVVALTMMDLLAKSGQTINSKKLSEALGVAVVPVDGRTGWGVGELMTALRERLTNPFITAAVLAEIPDEPVEAYRRLRAILDASGAVKKSRPLMLAENSLTARIDKVVLHRYAGLPIFFIILGGLFASIFWLAQPFMDFIEWLFKEAGALTLAVLPEGILARFIAEGIIGGVGAVAVFFPQILILFFLMTLLEDSGYLSRGAALVDRPLSALGLHGRSFVPMLSGFACAIPAVLAARTIPSKRERLLTIWIIPLMSCSARLPVYALLLAALLPGAVGKAGLALACIYLASLLTGSLTAGIIGKLFIRKKSDSMLAMEMPLYRRPLIKPTLKITWSRASAYLKRAGAPIIIISSILWMLSNFGLGAQQPKREDGTSAAFITASDLDHSFAAQLGQSLEPVLRPMAVDWRVGVGLISAFAAREVFVSTMAIVFHVADENNEQAQQAGLLDTMREATFANSSQRVFTPSSIIGLMVFFFFSLQCLSTVSVVRAETNSWKMAGLQLLFYTGLGYLLSVAVVQGLRVIGVA
ncbi:MAG: ferrous iron transporter B [Acidobacteria bacterium]|nr:ferrous iron transporter B [Acidobacteriota bacterium]